MSTSRTTIRASPPVMLRCVRPDTLIVTDPGAAAFLGDPKRRRYFEPFLGQERSVPEVARGLNEHPNSVLYRVRQMERLNLLQLIRTVPRRGRAEKRYRSVADRLFLPFTATTHADLHEALTAEGAFVDGEFRDGIQHWLSTLGGDGSWGLEFSLEAGRAHLRWVRADGRRMGTLSAPDRDVLDVYALRFPMTPDTAARFREELRALLTRYAQTPTGPVETAYSWRVQLVPHESP